LKWSAPACWCEVDFELKTAEAPQSGIGVYPDLAGLCSDKLLHSEIKIWRLKNEILHRYCKLG